MASGFRKQYPTGIELLLGGEDAAFRDLRIERPAVPAALPGVGVGVFGCSDVIDLKTTGDYEIIAPVGLRFAAFFVSVDIVESVACTVAPTLSVGSNASAYNDTAASATPAAFTTQAANSRVSLATVNPLSWVDLTANGLRAKVTGAATATTLTARILAWGIPVPV